MAATSALPGRGSLVVPARTPPHIPSMSDTEAVLRISLNGEPRAVAAGLTVATLLDTLGLDRRKVAIERNEAIVSRSTYDRTAIEDGDLFEIVHFIGGG